MLDCLIQQPFPRFPQEHSSTLQELRAGTDNDQTTFGSNMNSSRSPDSTLRRYRISSPHSAIVRPELSPVPPRTLPPLRRVSQKQQEPSAWQRQHRTSLLKHEWEKIARHHQQHGTAAAAPFPPELKDPPAKSIADAGPTKGNLKSGTVERTGPVSVPSGDSTVAAGSSSESAAAAPIWHHLRVR